MRVLKAVNSVVFKITGVSPKTVAMILFNFILVCFLLLEQNLHDVSECGHEVCGFLSRCCSENKWVCLRIVQLESSVSHTEA